ncbi:hypothetical protein [Roseovarius nitratireducens]|uniref:hypothetical protein n=1 Tax=Roseovarius nitratireducens TaxID=2044597 RepID=UPI000CE1E933|nr:hypothetical protein [Roseovarius nitratireducens]
MPTSAFALVLLAPFIAIFAYAAWHEWHRVREDGHSNYGLAYDPETDSTHVTLLEDGEAGYDPETENAAGDDGDTGQDETR